MYIWCGLIMDGNTDGLTDKQKKRVLKWANDLAEELGL